MDIMSSPTRSFAAAASVVDVTFHSNPHSRDASGSSGAYTFSSGFDHATPISSPPSQLQSFLSSSFGPSCDDVDMTLPPAPFAADDAQDASVYMDMPGSWSSSWQHESGAQPPPPCSSMAIESPFSVLSTLSDEDILHVCAQLATTSHPGVPSATSIASSTILSAESRLTVDSNPSFLSTSASGSSLMVSNCANHPDPAASASFVNTQPSALQWPKAPTWLLSSEDTLAIPGEPMTTDISNKSGLPFPSTLTSLPVRDGLPMASEPDTCRVNKLTLQSLSPVVTPLRSRKRLEQTTTTLQQQDAQISEPPVNATEHHSVSVKDEQDETAIPSVLVSINLREENKTGNPFHSMTTREIEAEGWDSIWEHPGRTEKTALKPTTKRIGKAPAQNSKHSRSITVDEHHEGAALNKKSKLDADGASSSGAEPARRFVEIKTQVQAIPSTADAARFQDNGRCMVACDACKKRKMRCTNEAPKCANCIRRGMTCSYAPRSKTRGKARDVSEASLDTTASFAAWVTAERGQTKQPLTSKKAGKQHPTGK